MTGRPKFHGVGQFASMSITVAAASSWKYMQFCDVEPMGHDLLPAPVAAA